MAAALFATVRRTSVSISLAAPGTAWPLSATTASGAAAASAAVIALPRERRSILAVGESRPRLSAPELRRRYHTDTATLRQALAIAQGENLALRRKLALYE
jgi:hypothetical protein